jgi:hypothetical protein
MMTKLHESLNIDNERANVMIKELSAIDADVFVGEIGIIEAARKVRDIAKTDDELIWLLSLARSMARDMAMQYFRKL